jgi:hypothetical protein
MKLYIPSDKRNTTTRISETGINRGPVRTKYITKMHIEATIPAFNPENAESRGANTKMPSKITVKASIPVFFFTVIDLFSIIFSK